MKKNFIEVAIKTEAGAGDLLGLLDQGGCLGCWEEEGVLHLYWLQEIWGDTVLQDILRALKILGIETLDEAPAVSIVEDRDWNSVWAASLQPIRLGRSFRIRQSWHPADPGFNGIELILDPKRAFGTGYHATTQLVLQWLEDSIRGGECILDVGTGSGILSMAAVRLGADSALALDIDAAAVDCAREYAGINGFGKEIEFRVASFKDLDPGAYDVVLANIEGRTLLSLCPYLPALLSVRGLACFSGLQRQDYEEISDVLERAGYRITAQRQQGEWLALEIRSSVNVQS